MPSRKEIEHLTAEECKEELRSVFHTLENVIDNRSQDANFLQGVVKFCNRVEKLKNQPSKLASSFHMFSSAQYSRAKVTGTSMRPGNKRKISVQPEAVKRRYGEQKTGSKSATVKGMIKKKNPFNQTEVQKKRPHMFSQNVRANERVSKKAGRTMSSKTKHLSCGKDASSFKNEASEL